MKIEINMIKVAARIRKQTVKLDELAADIQENGLINPITVMPSGGEFQLLAGLRRLKAAQSLGWTDIEVNCVDPKDAEAAFHIEHSENEQREPLTFSEKMDYARLIEEIEQAKSNERMLNGKKINDPVDQGPQGSEGKTREIVGGKIGMSGRQYDRAKYIADKASEDDIDAIDRGESTIRGTYDAMRAAEKQSKDNPAPEPPFVPTTFQESDLDRAIRAEQELDAMKYRQHNEIYHRDGIIENLKRRVAELEEALAAANARIHELESRYETASV